MQFQRVASNQLLVQAPLEQVREAAWQALWNARIHLPVIDTERNLVSGTQGDGILTVMRVATAKLEPRPEGTLVSFQSKPILGGFDLSAKSRAKKLTTFLEQLLQSNYSPASLEVASAGYAVAPIADPSGAGAPALQTAQPLYGPVLAPKRGTRLLSYAFFSLLCCQILAPIAFAYGIGTLIDYKKHGNPGDKGLVIASMVFSLVVTVGTIYVLFNLGF